MIDIYLLNRENMISTMQNNLKIIRQVCGWSTQELGEYMGLTRQSINNIESKKTAMSATQYVALCAVIDRRLKDNPELIDVVSALLSENDKYTKYKRNNEGIEKNISFLEKWFLSFPKYNNENRETKVGLEINEKELVTIAKYYKVFLTTDILEHKNAEVFLNKFTSLLKEFNNKIIIPLRVIKFMQDSMLSLKPEVYGPAKKGLDLLVKLQKEEVIDIRGEESDDTVNNLIQSVFAKHRINWRLMLFTQNRELTEDVLALNSSKGTKGYNIVVGKLNDDGTVEGISSIENIEGYTEKKKEEVIEVLEFNEVENKERIEEITKVSNMIEPIGWETIE